MLRNILKCAEFVYRLALSHFHTLDCDFAATYAASEHTVAKLIILIGKSSIVFGCGRSVFAKSNSTVVSIGDNVSLTMRSVP